MEEGEHVRVLIASFDLRTSPNFTTDLSSLWGNVFNSEANGFAAVYRVVCEICYAREIRTFRNETSCLLGCDLGQIDPARSSLE